MYLPTVVLLGTYGSSVRYHHEHGKYAAKHHVDTGPLRAIYMCSGIFGYGRGKGSTRAQIDGHQSSKLYSLRRSMQTWLGSLELAFGPKSGYSQV